MANLIKLICDNEACSKAFETKNPKKRFCCLHCKNQAAYNYNQKEYEWEVKMFKARRKNIQILEYLMNIKMARINYEELKKLGFDYEASLLEQRDEKNFSVFRYGNILLRLLSKSEYELQYIKTKK